MNKQENSTLSTSSKPKESGAWFSLKRFICPCLLPTSPIKERYSKNSEGEDPMQPQNSVSSHQSERKKPKSTVPSAEGKDRKHSKLPVAVSVLEMELKKQPMIDKGPLLNQQFSEVVHSPSKPFRRSLGNLHGDYPICSMCDRQLISVGINDRHLLVRIANIHLSPNAAALKRELAQSKPYYNRIKETQNVSNIDRFWAQRYALFERFDEGIRLDDSSWARTPPGPVCEWIAGKCSQAKLILDAFAGVGGTSIRIAGAPRCVKIIANDWNGRRLQCLINNAKVYDVDRCVELSQCNFLQYQAKGVEVVFVQPPIDQEMRTTTTGSLSIVDFEPTLDKIISKAMNLAPNFILLLPPAISIDVLCSCINKCATELGKMKNSCSAKLEKIYYQGDLKYVLVTVGRMVQDEIKLSHQLNFIYAKLQEPEKTPFRYKKLVKVLREQYGMIYLLNMVKECEKKRKDTKILNNKLVFDIFVDKIKEKNLISAHKLNKLLAEHDTSMEKSMEKKRSELNLSHDKSDDSNIKNQTKDNIPFDAIMEEQKVDQEMPYYRMSQQTQSEESHYSYLSGLGQASGSNRPPRVFAQSFGSIIIKRTLNESKEKRSISPRSPGKAPMSPLRAPKVTVSPHRSSQIVIGKQRPTERKNHRTSQIISKKSKQ